MVQRPQSLKFMIRLIVNFGGFLRRKGDGQSGAKMLWIGLQRIMNFVAGIRAYQTGDICV